MKQAISVVLAVFLVVLLLNLHIVHRKDGFALLWKDHLTLKDTFVDIRELTQQGMMALPLAVRELAMQESYGQQMNRMPMGQRMPGGYPTPSGMTPAGGMMPPQPGTTTMPGAR